MELAINKLSTGGKLGFIVPDSFLLGRYFSKIRGHILEHTVIEQLVHILAPVFKQATVGMSVICVFRMEEEQAVRQQHTMNIYQVARQENLAGPIEGCSYCQNYFSAMPHRRFRVFSSLAIKDLIDKMDSISKPLAQYASGHTGIRSLTRQQNIVACQAIGPDWRPGLISGSQVKRYGLVYGDHWLHIHPDVLYKGGWDPGIISKRKMLVRQTGYSLAACMDDNGYYHLNNIHSFVLRNETISLDYLLLLFNSRLMSFYYHAVAMEFGRSLAQTDIETLELLPICWDSWLSDLAPRLVAAFEKLMARKRLGEPGWEMELATLEHQVNQKIYQLYQLTAQEIAWVEATESSLPGGG
jgi:hypothetical protein